MNSRIYHGQVMHSRLTPIKYQFEYPLYYYCIDLDELPLLDKKIPFFGYNRVNLVSIFDRDYLSKGNLPIREKMLQFLKQEKCADAIRRIELITCPRYFNYVFNPVSFYYCYDQNDEINCVVAEVNNTFGERHLYILTRPLECKPKFVAHFKVPKAFHVSPFRDMNEDYDFHFSKVGDKLDIRLNLIKGGRIDFLSQLAGKAVPLTGRNLMGTLFKYPLSASLTMPRILWQAAKLNYLKKLKVFTKPNPSSKWTIRVSPPTLFERFSMKLIKLFFQRIHKGHFEVVLPDKTIWNFGQTENPVSARIEVKTYQFFKEVLFGTDIAFGDGYVRGDWITSDLTSVIEIFSDNREYADDRSVAWGWLKQKVNAIWHKRRSNTLNGSKENISAHYDLSNQMFQSFLDPSMMYSCALFEGSDDDLDTAQMRKIKAMIKQADIQSGDHVLEVGSGWGGFAIEAARQTGCRVTSITVSMEQFKLATKRVAEAGLSDRVEIRFCDYRDLQGQFDKIVSIEMVEAVGEEFLGAYFKTCERVLKPGGIMALQAITINDKRYAPYRDSCDWIKKYIFPGSLIPSLSKLDEVIARNTELIVKRVENFGLHYARTLQEWRNRFELAQKELQLLGYDERFRRMWEYYLCYSEAGFRCQVLGVVQVRIEKPKDKFALENQFSLPQEVSLVGHSKSGFGR